MSSPPLPAPLTHGDSPPIVTSLLSDKAILRLKEQGKIVIEPFVRENLATTSYDVTLGPLFALIRFYSNKICVSRHSLGVELSSRPLLLLSSSLFLIYFCVLKVS